MLQSVEVEMNEALEHEARAGASQLLLQLVQHPSWIRSSECNGGSTAICACVCVCVCSHVMIKLIARYKMELEYTHSRINIKASIY